MSFNIGYALLKELVDSGEKVRILIRKGTKQFDGIDCEKVYGDVTDFDALLKAFEGVDVVYHLAGIIDINADQEDMLWNVNVGEMVRMFVNGIFPVFHTELQRLLLLRRNYSARLQRKHRCLQGVRSVSLFQIAISLLRKQKKSLIIIL